MFETASRAAREPVQAPTRSEPSQSSLQRAVLGVAQAKLTVGSVDDPLEREADRVADRVVALIRRSATGSARVDGHQCGPMCLHRHPGHTTDGDGVTELAEGIRRRSPRRGEAGALLHRCGPECVHRHAGHDDHDDHEHGHLEIGAAGGDVSAELASKLRSSAGGGAALDPDVRRSMESAFGSDFSGVRVHTNSDAAPRIAATAFTVGNDIHFAPGAYQPASRSGQWLLGHELTHVVQQGLAGPASEAVDLHRTGGGCIHRHASKEHYMLGSMTPAQIRSIADAKENVEVTGRTGFGSSFKDWKNGKKKPPPAALKDALDTVQEQIGALNNWRAASTINPDPAQVGKGDTAYDHHWGGQMVTITCADGDLVTTVGELNALPDFFGSFEDLRQVDRSVAFKTLQVIRRESYVYLKSLEAQLQGLTYTYNRKTESFAGIEKNNVSLPSGKLPKFGNDAADVLQTATMLEGDGNEQGLDADIGAEATLGRNACHFPPESWLRWREHHDQARQLIASAADVADLEAKANKAIAMNAFGEHYLQDSFAGGHLINKGFVMAVAMEHSSAVTKKVRGMTDAQIASVQKATKHGKAYDLPAAAQQKVTGHAGPGNAMDDPNIRARDPQTALESAKAAGGTQTQGKRNEMTASGLDPNLMTFNQYRTWLNDFWFQKITNTLHDKYCINGLRVASPDNQNLFKIYGDNNMMRSGEGAEYAALTSQMSRNAINQLVRNRRNALTPVVPGGKPRIPAKRVTSVDQIFARFPNEVVDDDGTRMSLKEWATGAPMRRKIADMVAFFSKEGWTDGKLTRVVKGASPFKSVAAGLGPSHGPF